MDSHNEFVKIKIKTFCTIRNRQNENGIFKKRLPVRKTISRTTAPDFSLKQFGKINNENNNHNE